MSEKKNPCPVFLPTTDFPMRGGLPDREPQILKRWEEAGLYAHIREESKGREPWVLHWGPPYANGSIHIGHAFTKSLKDVVNRSMQMSGRDAPLVPGWDCHGLPIEWKVEEAWREAGRDKDADILEFRAACRDFAQGWVDTQKGEMRRLGVAADWDNPYLTMDHANEAAIAAEIYRVADAGLLYRGAKPVMWSSVEKTALAEAEVEYKEHKSAAIWVKFPIVKAADPDLVGASIVIWTTTPWTIPGNRAIAFGSELPYALYETEDSNRLILCETLAGEEHKRIRDVPVSEITGLTCSHPLKGQGYDFDVPLLPGDFVTEEVGTGFVHIAPGHGADDYNTGHAHGLPIHSCVDGDGYYTEKHPLFAGRQVFGREIFKDTDRDADIAVIKALAAAGALLAKQSYRHDYPHSWRSGAPVLFRTTPQWFIAMDQAPAPRAPDEITIRKLASDEWETYRALRLEALKTHPTYFGRTHEESAAWSEDRWRQRIEEGAIFAAFDSGTPVGLTGVLPDPDDPEGKTAHLVHSFVLPTHRSRGIGRLFYKARLDWVRAQGVITTLIAGHRPDNATSRHLILAHGFRFTHEAPKPHDDDPDRVICYYALNLAEATPATLRETALAEVEKTRWVPESAENRIRAMVEGRPDWCISRQRAWGVPIALFVHRETGQPLRDPAVDARVLKAFEAEGADAWWARDPQDFLGPEHDMKDYDQVFDIVDVWFESGATHAFVLEARGMPWPADLYLEGSDQHRGWFQSSLLEACATRAAAPYRAVLTHGFIVDAKGYKMSKSRGNVVAPADLINKYGADIVRLWAITVDYTKDVPVGDALLKSTADLYRRLRGTLRFLLGGLHGFTPAERVPVAEMPELECYILSRLAALDAQIAAHRGAYNFGAIAQALHQFCNAELSAFYFDIRKDSLYCDDPGDIKRRACRTVLAELFDFLVTRLAPILAFTAEEAWGHRPPGVFEDVDSVHLRCFTEVVPAWCNEALEGKWDKLRALRRVVLGAIEPCRKDKTIGSSLEAAPQIFVPQDWASALKGADLAELCIASSATITVGAVPEGAFILEGVPGAGVVFAKAQGQKCQRCWKILPEVAGDLCPRCAKAVAA